MEGINYNPLSNVFGRSEDIQSECIFIILISAIVQLPAILKVFHSQDIKLYLATSMNAKHYTAAICMHEI